MSTSLGNILEPVFAEDGVQRLVNVLEWIALHLRCANCDAIGVQGLGSLFKEVCVLFAEPSLDPLLKLIEQSKPTSEVKLEP